MEIRLIKPSDTEKFIEFYEKLVDETDYLMFTPEETSEKEDQEEEFIKNYDDYKQVFVAVDDDDEIIGYLGISRSHLAKLKHTAKFNIGVLEDHRRQGVATKLIDYAQKWAEKNGISRLELTVITENEPAVALFEKVGFEQEGTRKGAVNIDDDAYDEYYMAKAV